MTKELLFEIGTEEIPSGYMAAALKDLEAQARGIFRDQRIACSGIRTYGTPRRLTLHVERLQEIQDALVREVVGPAKAVAFDQEGRPTKAAVGFARAQGIPVEKLGVKTLDRGDYLVATIEEQGTRLEELLPTILPRLVASLSFPKFMRWGQGNFRFVRPIRWL
ncbi:MAG: glycine--tRNA ligase subunit beta, partial [candidate division NC10 bacterium]